MVLGTALNDSGIAIAGVMLGVMTPVLVVVTVRGDRARPRWAISPTAEGDRPDAIDLETGLGDRARSDRDPRARRRVC